MKTEIVKLHSQQGDVMLRRLSEMPAGVPKTIAKKRCVLAHGESGHSHVVEQDDAELIEIGGRMLLSIQSPATVEHEEHKPQTLEAGIWEIGRVREKDWFRDMVGPVMD
jgi:hypothetical protein